jgi:2-methylcitrate dehydratase PrpD
VAVHLQPVVSGLLDLLGEGLDASQVERVLIETSPTAYRMHGENPWQDRFRARLSTPFVTAAVLLDRACWLDQFTPQRVTDADVNTFIADRVQVVPNDQLSDGTATIQVHTADGAIRERHVDVARGDPTRPLSLEDTRKKFEAANRQFGNGEATEELIGAIESLESVTDMAEILPRLRREEP